MGFYLNKKLLLLCVIVSAFRLPPSCIIKIFVLLHPNESMPAGKKRKGQINNDTGATKRNRLLRNNNNFKSYLGIFENTSQNSDSYISLNSAVPAESSFSPSSCKKWFLEFTENDVSQIGPDGMERFCLALGVEPDNIVMLVLAYRLHAKSMEYFTLKEWSEGMQTLKCDNMSKLHKKIPYLESLLNQPKDFKEIYRYAFDFAIDTNQLTMEKSSAKLMIQLLFKNRWKLVDKFENFLDACSNRCINRDQWNNIYEFSKNIKDDCSNYDMNGAWPVLLDEFVVFVKSPANASSSGSNNGSPTVAETQTNQQQQTSQSTPPSSSSSSSS